VRCPEGLSFAELVRLGRRRLTELKPELASEYRMYRVDYDHNMFYDMERVSGATYEEALLPGGAQQDGAALFMPGCSLAAFSQALTTKVYTYLKDHGIVTGMTAFCCGNPLSNAGLGPQYDDYTAHFAELLSANGVGELVVACPNCYRSLQATLPAQVKLTPLPEALVGAGMRFSPSKREPYRCVTVHDSCPDRVEQRFATATRTLFSACEIVEMEHHGEQTICCGSGGLAGLGAPELARSRCAARIAEAQATGAQCMVASCAACCNSFTQVPHALPTKHYLELLFEEDFDWQALGRVMDTMFAAPQRYHEKPLADCRHWLA
jgi:Fe-S oxidoreductase